MVNLRQDTTREIHLLNRARWPRLYDELRTLLPDAFAPDGHVRNLVHGEWQDSGQRRVFVSPCDGTELCHFCPADLPMAFDAVAFAASEQEGWGRTSLEARQERVSACLQQYRRHRELLAYLLAWEIGKPYAQCLTSVDRCIDGVAWYVTEIGGMLEGRAPLGLISNIASWNYPMSVLMHAVLVQVLAGNAVIAKTPSDGGLCTLTLAFGLARQAGLPVSLLSGSGGELAPALVESDEVQCLAFVGGKTNGRDIASLLTRRDKRYMLEMEGVNAWGIWDFSDWEALAGQIRKGFEYGKQRCTAYPRYVIQRRLLPPFLAMYLPILNSLRIGHPLAVEGDAEQPPVLDFGPLINASSVRQIDEMVTEALDKGAIPLFSGQLDDGRFLPGQDRSAYRAPTSLVNIPHNCALYHREPFGPVDSIVVVDRLDELVAEMNVSNGNLVSSIATDDDGVARRVQQELRAFKVGINNTRSRGDRDEVFGGIGESWKGCFVGGRYLVQAVTLGGAREHLYGNFEHETHLPEQR